MGLTKTKLKNNIWIGFYLILFLPLFISPFTYGVTNAITEIDSFHNIISLKTGAEKISTQLDIAFEIRTKYNDEALRIANSAKTEAKAAGNKKLEMRSYYTLGRIYNEAGQYKLSLAYLDTALVISDSIVENLNKGDILYWTGVNNHRLGETVQALKSLNASIQACRLSDNFKTAGSAYSVM